MIIIMKKCFDHENNLHFHSKKEIRYHEKINYHTRQMKLIVDTQLLIFVAGKRNVFSTFDLLVCVILKCCNTVTTMIFLVFDICFSVCKGKDQIICTITSWCLPYKY